MGRRPLASGEVAPDAEGAALMARVTDEVCELVRFGEGSSKVRVPSSESLLPSRVHAIPAVVDVAPHATWVAVGMA